ncbi:hypothetical protein ACOZDF_00655 [Streptomyces griseoincarnatus]
MPPARMMGAGPTALEGRRYARWLVVRVLTVGNRREVYRQAP